MNSSLWWLYVTTWLVLCLTPGPAVLLTVSNALRYGTRNSILTILGILSANSVYFALSATGIGVLLLSSYGVFFLVKWVGAGYLIFLGVKSLLGRGNAMNPRTQEQTASRPANRLYADGFVLQMSNPKALLTFSAILPQFIDPGHPIGSQIAIYGLTGQLLEFCVLGTYATLAGKAFVVAREARYAKWTNRISGLFLIGAGSGLAMLRRD